MELRYTAQRSGRLSDILKTEMRMSTGLMNRLKWQNLLFVNGVAVHTDYAVQPGDCICVQLAEPQPNYPAQQGDLQILYEDDHILAVHKMAGMLIHPSRSKHTGTLANYVQGYYETTGQKSAFHPLTRLDRDTSGIVLIAKDAHTHALLQMAETEKTYHALVFGCPPKNSGIIDAPIARLPLPSLLRQVHPDGKPSISRYEVLERYNGYTLLALQPITGRTHQLRVHCAYMGFPILGDPQYGSTASKTLSNTMDLHHQALMARSLCFAHPYTGERLTLCDSYPLL